MYKKVNPVTNELTETRGKNFTQIMAKFGIKVEQKQVSEDPKTLKEIQFQQLPSTQTKSTSKDQP